MGGKDVQTSKVPDPEPWRSREWEVYGDANCASQNSVSAVPSRVGSLVE